MARNGRVRVLYSFPNKIGAARICATAWHQAAGVAAAGADVLSFPASVGRPLPPDVRVRPTLARGRFRIPYRAIGHMRAYTLHDAIVARRLERLVDDVDIVHAWPVGALETLRTARRLGIPTVLERPNSHTRYAYNVVAAESERLGITLPRHYEHAYDQARLEREEQEYALADGLLCPSAFVAGTFLDEGFPAEKLHRHRYGFDPAVYFPDSALRERSNRFTMLFAGRSAVRKGLHFALEAWLASPASEQGTFLVAGDFLPAYREKLAPLLSHRSVKVLGYRDDVPELMRAADVFVLPSIEEGYPLACVEARASGCVLLVSSACAEACAHMENGLVHDVGDVAALTNHITRVFEEPELLARLRAASLATAHELTWDTAGDELLAVYSKLVDVSRAGPAVAALGEA
jgi:glycosyltransferase involved in cell wall biosynthesis